MSENSCPRCGMYIPPGPRLNERFEPVEGPKLPHQCPPPFSYEQARAFMDAARAAGGIVTNSRTKARIKLGLELGPKP